MITQFILNVIGKTLISVITLIPPLPESVLSKIDSLAVQLSGISAWVAKLGVIMPWGDLNRAVQIFLAFWLAAAVMYVIRFVVSLMTGGGAK